MSLATEENEKEGYNIYDYWYILYTRRKVIYLMMICSVVIAAIISWILPPLYEAKNVFCVPARSDILTLYSSQDTKQVSRSPLLPESRGEAQIIYLGLLDSDFLRNKVQAMFPQKTVSQLKRNVDFRSGTNFQIKIYVRDREPQLAMQIANAYVALFNETLNGYSLKVTTENRISIENELQETQTKLIAARKQLLTFKVENKIALEEEELRSLTSQRTEHYKAIEDTQLSFEEVSKKLTSLKKQYTQELTAFSHSSVALSNPLIGSLKQQLSDLEAQIASAKIEYKGQHPEIEKLTIQYDRKMQDYVDELKRIQDSKIKSPNTLIETLRQEIVHLEVEKDSLNARKNGLIGRIEKIDQNIRLAPEIYSRINEFNWDIEQYKKRQEILLVNLEEALAQERRTINNAIVVDEASLPDNPVFPNTMLNMVTAFLLAIVVGVVYAFLMDFLERMKMDIQDDLRQIEKELL
ncbi:MAG: GNVR domain-containing protein [Methylomonas sp.]|nr:GNVR domain-containing protein [Methylomonas sp.]